MRQKPMPSQDGLSSTGAGSAIPWSAWGIKSSPFVTLYALHIHLSSSACSPSCRMYHNEVAYAYTEVLSLNIQAGASSSSGITGVV